MVGIKNKIVVLFAFLFLGVFVFAQTVTTPIDPIPLDKPCSGGNEVPVSECNSSGVPCIGKCFRSFRGGWNGGTEWFGACYHCEAGNIEILPGVRECVPGISKYEPYGVCDTRENKCCDNGKWSGFGAECLSGQDSCLLNQCWNGSRCVSKPSGGICSCTNGTCTISHTCSSGVGWRESKTCTCKTGYAKSPYTGECVHSTCLSTCSSGSYNRQKWNSDQCECCMSSCNIYHNGIGQCMTGKCNCLVSDISAYDKTCCQSSSTIYTLPSNFSTCDQFGQAAFSESGWREVSCPNCNLIM